MGTGNRYHVCRQSAGLAPWFAVAAGGERSVRDAVWVGRTRIAAPGDTAGREERSVRFFWTRAALENAIREAGGEIG